MNYEYKSQGFDSKHCFYFQGNMGLPGGYDSDAEGGLAGSSGLTGGFGEKAVSFHN